MGGTRLPSSRALANALNVSRTTVFEAYQQLLFEGYLEGRRGSGTFVARTVPDALLATAQTPRIPVTQSPVLGAAPSALHPDISISAPSHLLPASPTAGRLSSLLAVPDSFGLRGEQAAVHPVRHEPTPLAFRLGQPALDAFPHRVWQQLLAQRYRHSWQELFGYQEAAGYQPLREAIAGYLGVTRGVTCTPDQVIVTCGSQHGLGLIARILLQAGDAVWMEDPGYFGAHWVFQSAGLRLIPVPVDSAGFDVAAGQALAPDARLAYVTPSHQFPLGATMSLERRLALLEWAKDRGSWVIEDDYDSEYRYFGRPLPALQGLDAAGRVLYLGTFSKMLFPSLRLGYLVVPPALVRTFVTARRDADLHSPVLEQAVVADFIVEGHFVRHIRRMRVLYAERQVLLREAISQHLSSLLEVQRDPAGTHLVAWLPPEVDGEQVVRLARERDLVVQALSFFSLQPLRRNALVLGYAGLDERRIAEGVHTLVGALGSRRARQSIAPGWSSQLAQPNRP